MPSLSEATPPSTSGPPIAATPRPGDPTAASSAAAPRTCRPPRRRRRRTVLRVALSICAVLVVAAGATTYWALDRYVIDHVAIADVREYEEQAAASGAAPALAAAEAGDVSTGAEPAAEAVVTDTTYTSETMTVTVTEVVTGSGDDTVTYYVADVALDDVTALRGGFANNQFGTNIVENTSEIAAGNDAVFAINGDYYGFRDTGIVIRNGVLYRDRGARTGLAIYTDGTMEIYDETSTSGQDLIDAGVWTTLSFGPALVDGGEIVAGIEDVEIDTNWGNHSIQGNQPRTGLGMISANHFVFVAVDGRSAGYSKGVTMTEFAEIFQELGATVAYNLDGGGSTTMYFDGEVVNDPLGKGDERGTSDILYLAEAGA
jgi:exopolysaccharide biosynthesis protein